VGGTFLGSFITSQDLPRHRKPKIAFLGRSNVGKSSLLNLLSGTQIARVSKTPGRTRTLNLFDVDEKWIFGDFPGYGYAKVSKEERKSFQKLIEEFLTAGYFQFAVHIVDSRHPGIESDLRIHEWLQSQKLPHVVVLNKSDQLNQKQRAGAARQAEEAFAGQPLLFASTFTREGKRELEKIFERIPH
jgi:GTP-binding protein